MAPICGPGTFLLDIECKTCHESCYSCSGPAENQCTECTDDLYLEFGKCKKPDCGNQTWLKSVGCVDGCTLGTYPFEGKCLPCMADCLNCPSLDNCQECATLLNKYGECVESCPPRTYSDGTHCLDCTTGCEECQGPSLSDCTVCDQKSGFVDAAVGCQALACDVGSFRNGNVCDECDSSCRECFGPGDEQCSGCQDGFRLDGSTCVSCGILSGFELSSSLSCLPICGDGLKRGVEECDDGNI